MLQSIIIPNVQLKNTIIQITKSGLDRIGNQD